MKIIFTNVKNSSENFINFMDFCITEEKNLK